MDKISSDPLNTQMQVVKRNGKRQAVSFDKVLKRIRDLCSEDESRGLGKLEYIDPAVVSLRVFRGLYNGISTAKLDDLAADIAEMMITEHPQYGELAARIMISNHQKNTDFLNSGSKSDLRSSQSLRNQNLKSQASQKKSHLSKAERHTFSNTADLLQQNIDINGDLCPLLDSELYKVIKTNAAEIDAHMDYSRDYRHNYFGFKTLARSYLMKVRLAKTGSRRIVERPQDMWMRVALGIHCTSARTDGTELDKLVTPNARRTESRFEMELRLQNAFRSYDLMSQGYFTHATPTLFNAGTRSPTLSSCFLLAMDSDSVSGIYKTLSDCAKISKAAGGIGMHIHNIRAAGSYIRGTNGESNGIVPMLRVYSETAQYIDQGGNKRPGAFAIYLEPWHADIEDFLELGLPSGNEKQRARELFYAMWIPDLFMKCVQADEPWYLMCPDQSPGLADAYGDSFDRIYLAHVLAGHYKKEVPARKIWHMILRSQIETGRPYICYKDHVNKKTNHQNLGVIKSSNLCVTGDTFILTQNGHIPIKECCNREVTIWNGFEWSRVSPCKTGEDQEILKITFNDGSTLKCTRYHKFYIQKNYDRSSVSEVRAEDLRQGMKLIKHDLPLIREGHDNFPYPYTHGFFCGDGTMSYKLPIPHKCGNKSTNEGNDRYCRRHLKYCGANDEPTQKCQAMVGCGEPIVALYGEKKELIPYLKVMSHGELDTKHDKINCTLPAVLRKKFEVPLLSSIDIKLKWFAGYLDADGSIAENGAKSLQVSSIHKEFLMNIKLMLQTIGIHSRVGVNMKRRESLLPDGKGGRKLYKCKTLYRLLINASGLIKLKELGLKTNRLDITELQPPNRDARHFIKVVKIEKSDNSDTYCFNEPKRHMALFNGILAGNCTEIMEYSSQSETAVCNLASIALPKFVKSDNPTSSASGSITYFDFVELRRIAKIVTNNLNRVVDINKYPTPETRRSNMLHRPIGIGVQGLADVFVMMRIPFDSKEAIELDRMIFEHIYYAALDASADLAQKYGPYKSYNGCPISRGILQQDMWDISNTFKNVADAHLNWAPLRAKIAKYGIRNSLMIAPMPTASTSQILGNNECFEPYKSLIYKRKTSSGEFTMINKFLITDLVKAGLWNAKLKNKILLGDGSIQSITEIPVKFRNLYKTVWDMSPRVIINHAVARGPFIDQSNSMNLYIASPTIQYLSKVHFYGWRRGLKTGSYYIHSRPSAKNIQVTIPFNERSALGKQRSENKSSEAGEVCRMEEGCISCGS